MPTLSKLDIYRANLCARVKEAQNEGGFLTEEDVRLIEMLIELWKLPETEDDPTDLELRLSDFEEAANQGMFEVEYEDWGPPPVTVQTHEVFETLPPAKPKIIYQTHEV